MADSDGEYVQNASSDSDDAHNLGVDDGGETHASGTRRAGGGVVGKGVTAGTRSKTKRKGGKEAKKAAWEGAIKRDFVGLEEGADGMVTANVEGMIEAGKKKRLRQDTKPFQRGIIRHVALVLDLSEAMLEKDMRPNRYIVSLKYAQEYIREFFEQNPISQVSVLAMHDGVCIRVSELSGNPTDHIAAIQNLRFPRNPRELPKEPKGSPSLQNALELCRASLYHTPSHGTREVIIILGALLSLDPGDIYKTIDACIRDRIRVTIIGMSGRLRICQEICAKTNAGDSSSYSIATDQTHLRELLLATTTPPVIRADSTITTQPASLLMMGFPSRVVDPVPTLCACHGNLTRGGYTCSRCSAKVCALPASCPACGLTLILSTHLARSYHHLFPLRNWLEVSWHRAAALKTTHCQSCLQPFPPVPTSSIEPLSSNKHHKPSTSSSDKPPPPTTNGTTSKPSNPTPPEKSQVQVQGASESSRYECQSCHAHFCIDCDVFCHEVVHNCPGCLGRMMMDPTGEGGGGEEMEMEVDVG